MIIGLTQTKIMKDMEWLFTVKGKNFAVAESPFEKGRFQIFFHKGFDYDLRLYFNPSDTQYGSKLENRLSFHIMEQGRHTGDIVGRTKGFLLKGYAYYEMNYRGKLYQCYEVGLGNKGLFLCIYQGDMLIAIVEKATRVVDFKDQYVLYLSSKEYFEVTSMFALYYDVTCYGDILERKVHSQVCRIKITKNKEVIEKYDPEFIERIKKED